MITSVCGAPACPRPAVPGGTRCDAHRRRQGDRWHQLSRRKRQLEPICRCGAPATQVHHLRPVGEGHASIVELAELVSLCDDCHDLEHR